MKKNISLPSKNKLQLLIIIAAFAVVGVILLVISRAAVPDAKFMLTSQNLTQNKDAVFTADLWVDSGTQPIVGVNAKMSYPSSQLSVTSVVAASPTFINLCPNLLFATPGTIQVTCYVSPGTSLTGPQKVATITFKALAGTGTAAVNFVNESTSVSKIASSTGENIWNLSPTGITYTLSTVDTQGPTVVWTDPAQSAVVNGTSVPIKATVTDDRGIVSGVDLRIGNSATLYPMTASGSTYTYNWNTLSGIFPDGSYTLTIVAKDPTGNVNPIPATRAVQVLNNKPDLTVSSISVSPAPPLLTTAEPQTGDPVIIKAVVSNSNSISSAAIVSGTSKSTQFKIGNTILSTVTDTLPLAVGATYIVTSTVNWTAARGTSVISVTVNSSGTVNESSTVNNILTKSIIVFSRGDTGYGSSLPGVVDFDDLTQVLVNWNKTNQLRINGELNNADTLNTVNFDDLVEVLTNWTR